MTKVLIWKVEEAFEELVSGVKLTDSCKTRLANIKLDTQRRQFLSIRHLFKEIGYSGADLYYDNKGKPHLYDENYISMTHSHNFSGIIVSEQPVGIDIEKQREKILGIANKFTPLEEYRTLANEAAIIRKLTIVWGAKEAVYKLNGTPGLSFLNHIDVEDFDFDAKKTQVNVNYQNKKSVFSAKFTEFEDFTCVYALARESF